MYGISPNLGLSQFEGAVLIQLCIGEFQLQFHFHPVGSISVEGKWELRNSAGLLIDGAEREAPYSQRGVFHAHVLLGRSVHAQSVDGPRSFSLQFDSGHTLTVFDDSDKYESFSIQPGNVFV
jgi:hypothetical protein